MKLSKNEINIRRLLAKCEFMVEENNEENDWRIEKFVENLEDMILTLKKENDEQDNVDHRACNDALSSYVKRKDFLKSYLNTKKATSSTSKVVVMQSLPKVSSSTIDNNNTSTNEIYQKVINRYNSQIKEQLFERSEIFSMKQNDLDSVIGDQDKIQGRIVGNMLDMVKNMKHRSVAANEIIKQDITSAEKTSRIADVNQSQMKSNNDTLGIYNKGAYKCWLWVMLTVAFSIFFYMVMFIKLFKK